MSRSHKVNHVITHPCQSKDKHEATMGYIHEDTFPIETSREHAWGIGFEAGVTSTVTTWKNCTLTHSADKNNSCYMQEPLIPLSRLGSKPPNRDLRKNEIEANMDWRVVNGMRSWPTKLNPFPQQRQLLPSPANCDDHNQLKLL